MSEKDIVIRMRQLWCCKGAEFARPELQAGWEEIERLRETIECVEHEVALVYDHLTGGKISKCNTTARYVIDAVEERQNSWTDELIAEAMQEKNDEIERLRERVSYLMHTRGDSEGQGAVWPRPPGKRQHHL